MPKRKPANKAVSSISEARRGERIGDEELQRVVELQAMAWNAHTIASEAATAIERKLSFGAQIVSDKYEWDPDLRMVRTKRQKAGGE